MLKLGDVVEHKLTPGCKMTVDRNRIQRVDSEKDKTPCCWFVGGIFYYDNFKTDDLIKIK